jgi:anionic cell wall polymer biosynthesis LytR-Cps2A-Psr (LCP) family protein
LGVPVDYFVRINFSGFVKAVDAMGGLSINVEKPIHDAKYPDSNYGTYVLDIPVGIQQMDGARTLEYARSRHGSTDFDRMSRQQHVLLALRDKALSMDIPLSQVPVILQALGDSVKTDIPLNEMLTLADLAKKVDRSKIRQGVIDSSMTTDVTTPEGAMVQVPDWDKVRQLVDGLFPTGEPTDIASATASPEQVAAEGARILVQNGTAVANLAQSASAQLRTQGLGVMRYENADRLDHVQTLLVVYAEKPATVQALTKQLGVLTSNVVARPGENAEFDVLVILGQDYAERAAGQ